MAASQPEQIPAIGSGHTTPEYSRTPRTVSTGADLYRSDSEETLHTALDEYPESVGSDASRVYPGPPLNSPVTQSEVGDADRLNVSNLATKLNAMPARFENVTPPTSVGGDSGKPFPYGGVAVRDFAVFHDPPLLQRQMHTSRRLTSTHKIERDASTPTKSKVNGAAKEFPEHSIWGDHAEEDVILALKRMAMLAKDEHKNDGSKTVKQYYGERLARLLKQAEIHFDCSTLH